MAEQDYEYELRIAAIVRFLAGERPSELCRALDKPRRWFYYWLRRYNPDDPEGSLRDKPPIAHQVANRTLADLETIVVNCRTAREAKATPATKYALIGADAIYYELEHLKVPNLPCPRTIHRILARHGKILPRQEKKWEPSGKWSPKPDAQHLNDVHQVDFVGPRYLRNDSAKYYFLPLRDIVSLRWRIIATDNQQSQTVTDHLVASWKVIGCPKVLQMDNGTAFVGSNHAQRTFGRVIKLCLDVGVVPWFVAPGEPWRNGLIEQANGMIDTLLWKRQKCPDFACLRTEAVTLSDYANSQHRHVKLGGLTSDEYVHQNPEYLRPLEKDYERHRQTDLPLKAGQIVFVRMVRKSGRITIKANDKFDLTPELKYQYVQAVVDTEAKVLRVYHQDVLIKQFDYPI